MALIRAPITRAVSHRLLLAIPLLFVVSALSFVLTALTPGDPARSILGIYASPEAVAHLRHQLGLDQPLYIQYWDWLRAAVHGDFGRSLFTSEPVSHLIDQRLPVTMSLIAGALLVTVILGVTVGFISATRGGAIGHAVDGLALVGFALPAFWVGAVLITVFAVDLHWVPAVGYVPFAQSPQEWARSLVLPVFALALSGVAVLAKQTREGMLDALSSEYIRIARATGISPTSILARHAFKNTAIRVVTVLGLQIVGLLGGTVFVEWVFELPGLGGLAVSSATQHDLPVIQGVVAYFTMIVIAITLVVDIAYVLLNPKVSAA